MLARNSFTASHTAATVRPILKHILQRELHDSRRQRTPDLAKRGAVEHGGGIVRPEAVRDVVGLSAKLHVLSFMNPKYFRKGSIELPRSRAPNARAAHLSERAQCGYSERGRVEVASQRPAGSILVGVFKRL